VIIMRDAALEFKTAQAHGSIEMKKFALAGALSMLASAASSHDMHELTVSKITDEAGFIQIYLTDTVKDQAIVCAVYDEAENLVVSGDWYTSNLATEVTLRNVSEVKPPFTAKCVEN
jgi:hypothetical protein